MDELFGHPVEFTPDLSPNAQWTLHPLEMGMTIKQLPMSFEQILTALASIDVKTLVKKDAEYGSSWKKRGGVGAFMMLARKWDRLETQMTTMMNKPHPRNSAVNAPIGDYDLFTRIEEEKQGDNTESILETIRDLRRYCLLVESEIYSRRSVDKHYRQYPEADFTPQPSAQSPPPEKEPSNEETILHGPIGGPRTQRPDPPSDSDLRLPIFDPTPRSRR